MSNVLDNPPKSSSGSFPQSDHFAGVQIQITPNHRLKSSLSAIVESNEDIFIASLVDLPLYCEGDTAQEAINFLKDEIDVLIEELQETDEYGEEWARYRSFLLALVD